MNSALLHRKRQNSTVLQPNRELGFITSKKISWTVFHPNRLNRFISKQRTRLCYIEKDKSEPFLVATENVHCYFEKDKTELFIISTKSSALLNRKRHDWTVLHPNRLHRFLSEQRNRRCYIEKHKTEPFPSATEISNESNFYDTFEKQPTFPSKSLPGRHHTRTQTTNTHANCTKRKRFSAGKRSFSAFQLKQW